MATSDLKFSINDHKRYEATFESSGERTVVQLAREKDGELVVYANVPDMTRCPIFMSGTSTVKNVIFEVDVPKGIYVTVESMSNVSTGKVMG